MNIKAGHWYTHKYGEAAVYVVSPSPIAGNKWFDIFDVIWIQSHENKIIDDLSMSDNDYELHDPTYANLHLAFKVVFGERE
jgi:hypothetical protein